MDGGARDSTLSLVADVGGTNTRMAFALGGAVAEASVAWFKNEAFSRFEDVLLAYLKDRLANSLCVAIAGPVTASGKASLTNLDWEFDHQSLSAVLGGAPVRIINDLAAVGYALPALPDAALLPLLPGTAGGEQALVVGIGTGFNVSMVRGDVVLRAELGHATLPVPVARVVAGAGDFPTVETLFSGRGLRALHIGLGHAETTSQKIVDDPSGADTRRVFAEALSVFCREMVYQYLPLGGMFFNGGLARGLLQTPEAAEVLGGFGMGDVFEGRFSQIPLNLVLDDAAALHGCARYLDLVEV